MAALKPGKRRRSPSPAYETGQRSKREKYYIEDDSDDEEGATPWYLRPDPVKSANVMSSSPVPAMTKPAALPQRQPSPSKRPYHPRALKRLQKDATLENIIKEPAHLLKHCKFAKAGCPFEGSLEDVTRHEENYCAPLYTQLAHFKMLAKAKPPPQVNPPHPVRSFSAHPTSPGSSSQPVLQGNHQPESSHRLGSPTHSDQQQHAYDALQMQVQRLQSDLGKAQKQLEDEKNLRTERLRKASERCLALMSLSELGEGKAEVLRLKLAAERNLREKLEEEVECLRASVDSAGSSEASLKSPEQMTHPRT